VDGHLAEGKAAIGSRDMVMKETLDREDLETRVAILEEVAAMALSMTAAGVRTTIEAGKIMKERGKEMIGDGGTKLKTKFPLGLEMMMQKEEEDQTG